MDDRKLCLKRQTALRQLLSDTAKFEEAIEQFLSQHASLHTARMAGSEPWSFEDQVLDDIDEQRFRRVPENCEHSIAWIMWHLARCEDVTMTLLVAGSPQVLSQDDWLVRTRSPIRHTGNEMDVPEIVDFSAALDLEALRGYRMAVGRRTREIVQQLAPQDLKRKVDPARVQQIWDQGAVIEAAGYIVEYWSKRDVKGLLLMPASRHIIVHLNEALKLKKRRR